MTTAEIWLLGILSVLALIVGPIACSAFICVPKWWEKKVKPSRIGQWFSEWREKRKKKKREKEDWTPPNKFVAWIGIIATCLFFSVILLFVAWIDAWRVLVTRSCPYTESESVDMLVTDMFSDIKSDWLERVD